MNFIYITGRSSRSHISTGHSVLSIDVIWMMNLDVIKLITFHLWNLSCFERLLESCGEVLAVVSDEQVKDLATALRHRVICPSHRITSGLYDVNIIVGVVPLSTKDMLSLFWTIDI